MKKFLLAGILQSAPEKIHDDFVEREKLRAMDFALREINKAPNAGTSGTETKPHYRGKTRLDGYMN